MASCQLIHFCLKAMPLPQHRVAKTRVLGLMS